ncbi:MAG: PEP-utilizing enzyme [Patescibacteria group bacterium]
MSSLFEKIKQLQSEPQDQQGSNAFPIFLNSAAYSGFSMKNTMGVSYRRFLFNYKDKFGLMSYFYDDLERIWLELWKRIKDNPKYIRGVKQEYETKIFEYEKKFINISPRYLQGLTDDEVLSLVKEYAHGASETVGMAHIIEPLAYGLERVLKTSLEIQVADKGKIPLYCSILSASDGLSFMGQEEAELAKIAGLPKEKQDNVLEVHWQKYFWINNSYTGPNDLPVEYFRERMNKISVSSPTYNLEKRRQLIKELNLDSKTVLISDLISFAAIWQDQRKIHILKNISYFAISLKELAQRSGIALELLYYMGTCEITAINSISELKKMENQLRERTKGVYFLLENGEEYSLTGEQYLSLNKTVATLPDADRIDGVVAMSGKAKGRVIVCRDFQSLNKINDGDILVTVMTRPEFVPYLSKVRAIITDEGGITCHAAIVSREMRKPCIIGTKFATKVLKDGDMVEVDADKGIVKALGKIR